MIRVEIDVRVQGDPHDIDHVGTLDIWQQADQDRSDPDVRIYDWCLYTPGQRRPDQRGGSGLEHRRSLGALVLVRKVLEELTT